MNLSAVPDRATPLTPERFENAVRYNGITFDTDVEREEARRRWDAAVNASPRTAEFFGNLCAVIEAIYHDGPEADLTDPPRFTSPEARRHATHIVALFAEYEKGEAAR
jgi:hypothetical protein